MFLTRFLRRYFLQVSLPTWVLEVAEQNPDVLFTDREGRRNSEYLSFGVDHLPLFQGRTPLQIYRDFMRSFRETFSSELGSTIVEVIVGMGPAGELRYPSYPQGIDTTTPNDWKRRGWEIMY